MSEENLENSDVLNETQAYGLNHKEGDQLSDTLARIERRLSELELYNTRRNDERAAEQTTTLTPLLGASASSATYHTIPEDVRSNLGARPKVNSSSSQIINNNHTEHTSTRSNERKYCINSPYQATHNFTSPEPKQFTAGNAGSAEIQESFNAIKSTVDKVTLPPHMKLHDSRAGIKREDQPLLNVLSKSGRYVETILKLFSRAQEGEDLDIEPIVTVCLAHIQYLQEEYAACLVKGRFDDNTAQLFKALQKGTSGFTDSCLQNVRVAAELSSIANRYPSNNTRYNSFRGGYGRPRFGSWRGRGGFERQ